MTYMEKQLRQMAVACFVNARDLYEDACLLEKQQFPLITCESYVTMAADISRSVSTIHFRLLKRLSRSDITGRLLES